jgi:ectoine hydroxylase-related dioxygenase (phytanoyl-CoA dioxygenase family)
MNINKAEELYKDQGYVVLKNFLPTKPLKNFKYSLEGHITNQLKKHNIENETDPLNQGLIKLNAIRKDKSKFDSVQVIYNTIRKIPELFELITNEDLVKIVKKLSDLDKINENISPYIWEAFCRIDPPQDATFDLKWHQESFFTLPRSNSVQLWAPVINDITLKTTGTIAAIKDSHKKGEIPHSIVRHNDNYISESILPNKLGDYEKNQETFSLNVGDVLLFHEHLIHRTINNTGSKVRYTMIANYSNPCQSNFKFMISDFYFFSFC